MSRGPTGCGAVRGDLGFLLLPDIDPERAKTLKDHLAGCPSCRLLYTRVRANYEALRREPTIEPGPGFSRQVMDRLPRRVPRRRRLAHLGVLALLAGVGFLAHLGVGSGTAGSRPLGHLLTGATDLASRLATSLLELLAAVGARALWGDPLRFGGSTIPEIPAFAGPPLGLLAAGCLLLLLILGLTTLALLRPRYRATS
jgi:predicted anti-sigma-YlaC factor YlaD